MEHKHVLFFIAFSSTVDLILHFGGKRQMLNRNRGKDFVILDIGLFPWGFLKAELPLTLTRFLY